MLIAAATSALAMGAGVSGMDANGDGILTLDEVQAVHPEVTEETFVTMDANGDGALDDAETTAAEEAGVIKMPSDS